MLGRSHRLGHGKKPRGKKRKPPSNKGSLQKARQVVLDRFSQNDLRGWQRLSDGLTTFQYKLYFELEAQRAAKYERLLDTLRSNSTTFEFEGWVRATPFVYSLDPLSPKGSLKQIGGRFNIGEDVNSAQFPPFGALYLAEDFNTALCEKYQMAESETVHGLTREDFALIPRQSMTFVYVRGVLNSVLDLTSNRSIRDFVKETKKFTLSAEVVRMARSLGLKDPYVLTTAKQVLNDMFRQDWRVLPQQADVPSNSQVFGRMLKDAGVEAVLYSSTKGPKRCLAAFVENFEGTASQIELQPGYPAEVKESALNSDTWKRFVGAG